MATAAPHPTPAGDTAYLYRAAIGPRGQDYYLRHFARFDGEGKAGTSWNWAAYWTTFNWLLYRKMWGWALAYVAALLGLALLVFGVGKLVLNYSDTSAILLSLLLLTAAFVVPGLYANAWFYTHCNEKITAALRKTTEIKEAATLLAAEAPQQRRLWVLALANAVVLSLALVMVNWLQGSESPLPQLAREQTGTLQAAAPAVAPPPAPLAATPAPEPAPAPPVASAVPAAPADPAAAEPSVAASTPVSAPVSTPAPAASEPAASPAVRPAPPSAPAMLQAADRPARAEPAPPAPAPPSARTAAAPAQAPAAATPPVRKPASPLLRYVWVVQVGAYAQEENARKALAQVQSLGLEAGAESFGSQPLTRVRVGPFTRQDEAERAALRIKSLDLPALVIRQRP